MLNILFDEVLDSYINEYKTASYVDPIYDVLTNRLPTEIRNLFPTRSDLLFTGSCGTGQKTDYPWVAVFNRRITTSATRGLYLVYLFKKDMTGFYLSLNQGITYYRDRFKRKKYEYARKVANYFRNEIGDDYFDKGNIELGGTSGTLGYGYQETNIISKYYAKGTYTEETLTEDLRKMLAIYDELAGVLGEDGYDYNSAIDKIVFDDSDSFEPAEEAIDNIKKTISSPTDLNIVRTLKYVEPKEKGTKKYSKLRTPSSIKKLDYIEKAKGDMEIGQLGEMLALQFERERLIKEGHPDLADKVRRVSVISDAYGFDIISYDLVGAELKEVYIEVKTTANKLDIDFQVSKNEVLTSNEKKQRYCVFRIYDVKSPTPSFYKVFGKIEDNFELNPITYLARYVGNKINH